MHITAQLVHGLVADQFPHWSDLEVSESAHQGNDNRTFRLGDELSVRLPSAEPYAAGVSKENRVLPALSGRLPVDLPDVLAVGRAGRRFPLPWSVRRWLAGDVPADASVLDRARIAEQLGQFLLTLRSLPVFDGVAAGRHSFFRGCHPSVYGDEVEAALLELGDRVDADACRRIWSEATRTAWPDEPVWFHGDIAEGNMLIRDGALGAVIDWGTCGAGDPACDLVVAWTFMEQEREIFRQTVGLDDSTWARARGWALWKSLITATKPGDPLAAVHARALDQLLAEAG